MSQALHNSTETDYPARARDLAPLVEGYADDVEAARRLPDGLVTALIDAGFFRLLLPRWLNGAQLEPAAFVQTMQEIARADASTAWCLTQNSGCSMVAAYLHPALATAIFGQPRGILAWGPPAPARAVAVPGGYQVTGTWNFLSGVRHASWVGGACPVVNEDGTPRLQDDGSPEERTVLFPAADVALVDVWRVIGLRGTASDSFSVTDRFVPRERTVARDHPAERRDSSPLYCFPTVSIFAAGFAGVALGLARRMLDDFVMLAGSKTARGNRHSVYQNPAVQAEVGLAEGRWRAAQALLLSSLRDIWQAVLDAGVLTLTQRIDIRLAASHAIREARAVADAAYHQSGSTAIFHGGMERRFRDMHALAQQIQGRDDHFQSVGRFLLGLSPDSSFL